MTGYARNTAQSCRCSGMASPAESSSRTVIPSASCGLADLVADAPARCRGGGVLELGPGWAARWTAAWKVSGAEAVCPVRDLGAFPVPGCEPVRKFSWARGQRHRPGLQFMVSTGLHHGLRAWRRPGCCSGLRGGCDAGNLPAVPFAVHDRRRPRRAHPQCPGGGVWRRVADRRPPRWPDRRGRSGEVCRLRGGGAGVRVAVPAGGGLAAARDGNAGYLVFAAAAASRPVGLQEVLLVTETRAVLAGPAQERGRLACRPRFASPAPSPA
jgi:hypothetical protein